MKIRNNKNFNVSLLTKYEFAEDAHGNRVAAGVPARLTLVAGATLEVDDGKWAAFAEPATAGLKSGAFTMITKPLTKEEAAEVKALAEETARVETAAKTAAKKTAAAALAKTAKTAAAKKAETPVEDKPTDDWDTEGK